MDPGVREALVAIARRRQDRRLVLLSLFYVVAVLIGAVVGVVIATHRHGGHHHHHAVALALLIAFGAGLLAAGLPIGLILWQRRRGVSWLQPSPVMGVDRVRRKRIVRAIRKNYHLDGDDEELAIDTAQRWVRLRKAGIWLAAIFLLSTVLQLVLRQWLIAGYSILLLALFGSQYGLIVRRGRRYLAQPSSTDARRPIHRHD